MPISLNEYRQPQWIKLEEGATLSRDNTLRWYNFSLDKRGWPMGWKYAGYSPIQDSTRIDQPNIDSDSLTLKPQ